MYDIFIPAPSDQDVEIKKNQGCFSPDVHHTHDRVVSLARLWVYTPRFTFNFGKQHQPHPLSLCPVSQAQTWIRMTRNCKIFHPSKSWFAIASPES
jgi:hypothetical protein